MQNYVDGDMPIHCPIPRRATGPYLPYQTPTQPQTHATQSPSTSSTSSTWDDNTPYGHAVSSSHSSQFLQVPQPDLASSPFVSDYSSCEHTKREEPSSQFGAFAKATIVQPTSDQGGPVCVQQQELVPQIQDIHSACSDEVNNLSYNVMQGDSALF
ncbi:hypothetical protein K435DRAFT_839392 [Dendrothele bispora CBS 962.96]|uniref:Uncharacterized protein n=1 Tax=Dendrothele bispora (strain CBS 962.96) TaxID=1314807 RepID=A0A4S8LPB9_DENBC|nr:hypothetical protein K435DRAFT_841102 [Dendrothele bispora CBS 962.96]THU95582.1 hypothetical protein K435DRAFT_839392 [Dendrothele bispora CBS 962.96]